MKILFCDYTLPYLLKDTKYPVGGWAVELNTWLKGLCACGLQPGVLTWAGANKYITTKLNYYLLDTYEPTKGIPVIKYFNYYIPAMLKAAKQFNPDIIIQSCSGLQTGIMAFIAQKLKVPFVYRAASDRDSDERYKIGLPVYARIAYKYGLSTAHIILSQNERQQSNFRQHYSKKKIYVLHNPIDISVKKIEFRQRNERNYIAWLGIFKKAKNIPLLYETAKLLPHIPFHIAGMPSKNIDQATARSLEKLSQLANVTMVDYVARKDVSAFLSNAVALLSTSHYEGFSNTFLESLLVGTPIIAPERVDPDSIIAKNDLGFITSHDRYLPNLIEKIWNLKDKYYTQMAKRCNNYVVKRHGCDIKANELISILETAL